MGIDFNTFSNQDEHTLVLQKRYNAQGKEIATGVSYIFMDTIQEYINAGYLKDNNIDGQENVFSNTDKKNLGAKFLEIHQRHGYDTNFTKMHSDDTFTYTKDEIFELAEAAGYVVTNPITEPAAEAEEEPAEVQPEIEETAPAVDEVPVEENTETGSSNPFTRAADSDDEIAELHDGEYLIDIKGYEITDPQTGEIISAEHKAKVSSTDNDDRTVSSPQKEESKNNTAEQSQTVTMSGVEKELSDSGFYDLSKEDQLSVLGELEKEYQQTVDTWESDSSNKKHKKFLGLNIGAKTDEYKEVLDCKEKIAQIQELRNRINAQ